MTMRELIPYSYNKPTTPLLLSAEVTLQSGVSGVPDMELLTSPFREPIIIDEIRFSVVTPDGAAPLGDYSSLVTCRFRMGRVEFSQKDIPIWLYGTSMQQNSTEENLQTSGGMVDTMLTERRWKLPVPLFVPPGMSLVPYFQSPAGAPNGLLVRVSYAARYVNPNERTPKKIQVPYVAAFYPDLAGILNNLASAKGVYQTGEYDLANVLDTPVRVQRFIGRILFAQAGGGTFQERTDNGAVSGNGSFVVEIKDSYGREVVKPPLSFSVVFEEERRASTFSKILGPRERYLMIIRGGGNSDPTQAGLPMVSMVGFREEVFG